MGCLMVCLGGVDRLLVVVWLSCGCRVAVCVVCCEEFLEVKSTYDAVDSNCES